MLEIDWQITGLILKDKGKNMLKEKDKFASLMLREVLGLRTVRHCLANLLKPS